MLVVGHYSSYDRVAFLTENQKIAALTHFAAPSLSVAYYAPRILFREDVSNPAYPQMPEINRMDFVYEK